MDADEAWKKLIDLNASKKALSLVQEFKNFAFKGNVIDLAIGVIIGGAFGKLVDSMVKKVLMPAITLLLPGQQGYLTWKWVINGKEIFYGEFLGEVLNFLIVALVLFLLIKKFLGWIMSVKKEEAAAAAAPAAPPPPPPPTKDQELLAEIRDLLKLNMAR